jgi:hypothetical protein
MSSNYNALKPVLARDGDKTLDNVDFTSNAEVNRRLVFDLATGISFSGEKARCSSDYPGSA